MRSLWRRKLDSQRIGKIKSFSHRLVEFILQRCGRVVARVNALLKREHEFESRQTRSIFVAALPNGWALGKHPEDSFMSSKMYRFHVVALGK